MLVCSPVASELYNITVTCTIHPDSTANQCLVRVVDDGGVTRIGNVYILQVTALMLAIIRMYVATCIHRFVCTFHASLAGNYMTVCYRSVDDMYVAIIQCMAIASSLCLYCIAIVM